MVPWFMYFTWSINLLCDHIGEFIVCLSKLHEFLSEYKRRKTADCLLAVCLSICLCRFDTVIENMFFFFRSISIACGGLKLLQQTNFTVKYDMPWELAVIFYLACAQVGLVSNICNSLDVITWDTY